MSSNVNSLRKKLQDSSTHGEGRENLDIAADAGSGGAEQPVALLGEDRPTTATTRLNFAIGWCWVGAVRAKPVPALNG